MVVSFINPHRRLQGAPADPVSKFTGLGGLNVRQYPRSDIASIQVSTVYVGADAELVRGFYYDAARACDRGCRRH